MWAWLNGPGAVFKEPRSRSTNYVTGYLRSGEPAGEGRKIAAPYREDQAGSDHDEPPDTKDMSLQPFHLNPHFISPHILSLPFRDEIYRRVVEQGQTVREVSQTLSVSMERVGAVVRLRTLENDIIREVSLFAVHFPVPQQHAMMNQKKFD